MKCRRQSNRVAMLMLLLCLLFPTSQDAQSLNILLINKPKYLRDDRKFNHASRSKYLPRFFH